jgi:hypothetical protein
MRRIEAAAFGNPMWPALKPQIVPGIIGHLPVAYMILPEATLVLTLYVIVANSFFGLIAGYLYWQKGLESAMLAHMLAHVLLLTASYFGAYY